MGSDRKEKSDCAIEIEFDGTFFSADAILKACYWYSRQFGFELRQSSTGQTVVTLTPRDSSITTETSRQDFVAAVADFSLRERIEARTSNVREILLAKAFAEAGVLEDSPSGEFVDQVERENQQGLFKILPH